MNQTTHFFNLGYGWLCKHCSAEQAEHQRDRSGRMTQERDHGKHEWQHGGGLALARWSEARRSFTCPRCGIEEAVNKH